MICVLVLIIFMPYVLRLPAFILTISLIGNLECAYIKNGYHFSLPSIFLPPQMLIFLKINEKFTTTRPKNKKFGKKNDR